MDLWRRRLIAFGGLFVSALALWIVAQSVDLIEAVDVIATADPLPLVGILGVVTIQAVLRAWRWSILIPARRDGTHVTTARTFRPMLVGYLGNAVLPARLGEPMRAVILNRLHRVDMSEALGSVLVERLIDIATLALVGFSAARLLGAPAWIVQVLGVAAGIGAIGLIVLLTIGLQPMLRMARRLGLINRPGFANIATRFVTTLGGHSRRGALLAAFAVSVATWLLDATSFWLAGRSVGVDLPYSAAMIVSAISVLGTAVPSAPGYVGTFELAAAGTAGALGIPSSEALALAVVVHTMTLIPLALAGAASLISINVKLGDVARAAEARRDG